MSFSELAVTILGSSTVVGGITWLTQWFLNKRTAERLENLKAQLVLENSVTMERMKSDLAKDAKEHEIRFKRIYDKTSDVIIDLFLKLQEAFRDMCSYVSVVDMHGQTKEQKLEVLVKSYNGLNTLIETNRLFLPKDIYKTLDEFMKKMKKTIDDFQIGWQRDKSGRYEDKDVIGFWSRADEEARKLLPQIDSIIDRLKDFLGLPK